MRSLDLAEFVSQPVLRRSRNKLLLALPEDDFKRIAADLVPRPLRAHEFLHKRGQRLNGVYFLDGSVCSILATMDDGASCEVATIGQEGIIGAEAILGGSPAQNDVIVQHAGGSHMLALEHFEREMARRGAFFDVMMKYLQAFVGQLAQAAACNGLHSAQQRCARWLLTNRDLLGRDDCPLTHEMLSTMLGVRRPTVTLLIADLVKAGMIETSRGRIRILNRAELEHVACECYGAVRRLHAG
jgi:CRP-like cAMP-binding protein